MLFYDSTTEKLQAAERLVRTINIVCLIMPANHISLFNVIFNDSAAGRIEARETKEDCQHEYLLLFFLLSHVMVPYSLVLAHYRFVSSVVFLK